MEPKKQPKIVIYTATWCGYCRLAKEYFKSHNLGYTEHDVEADPEMAREAMEKSGQLGVPIIIINDHVIVGFDQAKIEELLAKSSDDSPPILHMGPSHTIENSPKEKMPEIVMYTTAWCSACKLAKNFFTSLHLNWTERDAGQPEIGREMIEKSGQLGVPVIFVGSELVVGFDEHKLRSILGRYLPSI